MLVELLNAIPRNALPRGTKRRVILLAEDPKERRRERGRVNSAKWRAKYPDRYRSQRERQKDYKAAYDLEYIKRPGVRERRDAQARAWRLRNRESLAEKRRQKAGT